ncbi:MAG: ATP-dependent helicase [Candidatus Ancillula sp.]|jgi:DNA helicase-2/ATP-dependent DNA helicase PcrA|nr:ATP-dependent helicase [Candidatus Ancillula sp.]
MIDDAMEVLDGLDENQKSAAKAISGPVAIVAGAGTGKTRTITHRIAYAVRSSAWKSNEVLAVTFTAKAAREMLERLGALGISDATVATFHSCALRQLLKFWPKYVGRDVPKLETNKLPHIIDAAEYHDFEISTAEASAIADEISWAKVSLISPSQYPAIAETSQRNIAAPISATSFARIFSTYDDIKSERGLIDFEDVLLLMIYVIHKFQEVRDAIRDEFKHIIVDEYQDVSPLQQTLLEAWLGPSRELCVVGDPSQTIYSFTGATPEFLLNFKDKFKPKYPNQTAPERVNLINDYRSSPQIVRLANRILKLRGREGFEPLKLTSKAKDEGKSVVWKEYPNDVEEAKRTAQMIAKLLDSSAFRIEDIAILARTNLQLQVFATELRAMKIPCFIKKDDRHIREVEQDKEVNFSSGVALVSLHSSKGLEWECVFLVGLSDGQVPISRAKDEYAIEEERRLLYVGVTRAKRQLVMSFSRAKLPDSRANRMRSRFLDKVWPAS